MGGRERPELAHSHAAKPSAAMASSSRINTMGAAALTLWTTDRLGPAGVGLDVASDSLGSPVASSSAETITVIAARAVNATRTIGRRRAFPRPDGTGTIPRSAAQEAANEGTILRCTMGKFVVNESGC